MLMPHFDFLEGTLPMTVFAIEIDRQHADAPFRVLGGGAAAPQPVTQLFAPPKREPYPRW
jgi:hypothetical protein